MMAFLSESLAGEGKRCRLVDPELGGDTTLPTPLERPPLIMGL